MNQKYILPYLVFILFSLPMISQPSVLNENSKLYQKIDGLTHLFKIMEIVDSHYDSIQRGFILRTEEPDYKHWGRWAIDARNTLDENGEIQNLQPYISKAIKRYQPRELSRSSTGNWSSIGPNEINSSVGTSIGIGRVDRIGFHPTDPNTFYLCTPGGGLLKTTNGGTTYSFMTDFLPVTSCSGVVVDHTNPNTVYLLTGGGDSGPTNSDGVYKSYDGGFNWTKTGTISSANDYRAYNISQSPTNAQVLIIATSQGLFRTSNGGGSWVLVQSGFFYEIKFDHLNSNRVYATGKGTFYRSSDGGSAWTQITNFSPALPIGTRTALAVEENTNSNPNIFVFSGQTPANDGCSGSGTFGGLYSSSDYGLSFTRITNSPNMVTGCCGGGNGRSQAGYDLAIAAKKIIVQSMLANYVVSGGLRVWSTQINAPGHPTPYFSLNRHPNCEESSSSGYVHVDIHDVEFNSLNGNLYVCTDGGLSMSTNNGLTWIDRSEGLTLSQAYHIGGSQINPNNFMIGLQDNGLKRHENDATPWDHGTGGDGFDVVYDKTSSTSGYCTNNWSIYRFSGNGDSYSMRNPPPEVVELVFYPKAQVHNTTPAIVLGGYRNIIKSTNGGWNWVNKGAAGNWAIESCLTADSRFYAAGLPLGSSEGKLYRSDDTGDSWIDLSSNVGLPNSLNTITDIEVSPYNANLVWVTFGGVEDGNKVFYSPLSGTFWQNISGDLPNIPVYCIQVASNGDAYLGTDIGVFFKAFSTTNWIPFWNGLPITQIRDIELFEGIGKIRVATYGRGVWESDLYSTCTAFQFLGSGSINGRKIYEASNHINSSQTVYGGANTNIIMKSGNEIILNTGFNITKGNNFRAYIAPCGTTIE